jgi:hypothetical protein
MCIRDRSIIDQEDSLLYIYKQPQEVKKNLFDQWIKRLEFFNKTNDQLFVETKKENNKTYQAPLIESTLNNKPVNDFYFQNKNAVTNGKQLFTQKWGERPNTDNWRRKTSGNIAYANTSIIKSNTESTIIKDSSKKEETSTLNNIQPITDNEGLENSLKKWNNAALQNAQLFLLELNDFQKALPIYRKIIERDINETSTERALLDLASQYNHDNEKDKSEAIIANVIKKYPNGFYVTKLNQAKSKNIASSNAIRFYTNAYFLSKIGKWDSLAKSHDQISQAIQRTKWNTPYQFIRVKMFAQQRKDSVAINILDSIILQNQNEFIRERAKNIITELKNRKKTEAYLSQLVNIIPTSNFTASSETTEIAPIAAIVNDLTTKQLVNSTKDSALQKDKTSSTILFTNDSTEEHYMAMVIKGTKEVFIKEAQNALDNVNNDEFSKLQLNATYVQFNEDIHIVWVGPFDTQKESIAYANKIKPRLKTELISFIPVKQYEIFIFGKSNILMINNYQDLLEYKAFMFKNIYK